MIHHNGVVLEYEIIANVFNGNKVSLMKLLEKKACTNIIILWIILLCISSTRNVADDAYY